MLKSLISAFTISKKKGKMAYYVFLDGLDSPP